MFSHLDEFYALVVEKVKFNLAKPKLKRKTWLVIINSRPSFITPTINGRNVKEIGEIFCEIFDLVKVYHKQEKVLSLAFDLYIYIVNCHFFDLS